MQKFANGGFLVETPNDLLQVPLGEDIFLDIEATSKDVKLKALNPWFHCWVCGLCYTADDCKSAWFIPVELYKNVGVPHQVALDWLDKVFMTAKRWINHNVKFDAHVIKNNFGLDFPGELWDTVTLAKLVDSDRMLKGGYSLKGLSRDWLHEDIEKFEIAFKPYLQGNKDYGRIPVDLLGEYGCQDVLTARRLFHYIESRIPEGCEDIKATEIALTKILYSIEQRGLQVNPLELLKKQYLNTHKLLKSEEKLEGLTGRVFRPHANRDCHEVLCGQYGLPVLEYTKADQPSFAKGVLRQYLSHPFAPVPVVEEMLNYRQINTFNDLFVKKFRDFALPETNTIHCFYNQNVRTGRMSCKEPNMQQLCELAKELIHPRPGYYFISTDASQIEFRVIVHYIQDQVCIDAYNEDPYTDFHTWVANMLNTTRRPAKTINFMMGYGGGKKRLVLELSKNLEIVGQVTDEVKHHFEGKDRSDEASSRLFERLCKARAEKLYNEYHRTLPGLKRTSYKAASVVKQRGYVFNRYGRHRHLPFKAAHLAFNSLCQSTAADLVKERMVELEKRLEGTGIMLVAQVHDEILLEAPLDSYGDERVLRDVLRILEKPSKPLRVPIRWTIGTSKENWSKASKEEISVSEGIGEDFAYLKNS